MENLFFTSDLLYRSKVKRGLKATWFSLRIMIQGFNYELFCRQFARKGTVTPSSLHIVYSLSDRVDEREFFKFYSVSFTCIYSTYYRNKNVLQHCNCDLNFNWKLKHEERKWNVLTVRRWQILLFLKMRLQCNEG